MRWFLEPHSKLHSSSGFCNTQTEMSITLCAGFLRVICPGQPDTLICCRSFYNPPWPQPCQRRPGFRHDALPWILSHWNIECQVNLRPGTAAGKAEHSDNPMMSGGEQLLQPVLTGQDTSTLYMANRFTHIPKEIKNDKYLRQLWHCCSSVWLLPLPEISRATRPGSMAKLSCRRNAEWKQLFSRPRNLQ